MKEFPNLDTLSIAAPCNADWESMTGDERKRLCGLCNKNVYNISNLSKTEAEDLLGKNKDLCVQFFRRQDGTILTANCPIGLRKVKEGAKRLSQFVAYVLAFAITIVTGAKAEAKGSKITLTGGVSCDVYPTETASPAKDYSGLRGRPYIGAVIEKPSTKNSGKSKSGKKGNNKKKQKAQSNLSTFQDSTSLNLYNNAKNWQDKGNIVMALNFYQKSLDAFDHQTIEGDPKFREQVENDMKSLTQN